MKDGIEAVRCLIKEGRRNLGEIDRTLYKMKVDQLEPSKAAEIMENIVILVEHRLGHLRSYQSKDLSDQEKEDLAQLIDDYKGRIEGLQHEG